MRRIAIALVLLVAFGWAISPGPAQAVPMLQLYIEGAQYDIGSETWVLSGDTSTVRLWTIGYATTTIYDVRLSVAYQSATDPTFTLTPSITGGYEGFADLSLPAAVTTSPPFLSGVVGETIPSLPVLSDGTSLQTHGIYEPGVHWQEFKLGDFTLSDSPTGDFQYDVPTPDFTKMGQINVYEVSLTGVADPLAVHFDLFDHTGASNRAKARVVPFSHDAETNPIPEPASLLVWSVIGAAAGLGALRRRRARWSKENRNAICQIIEQGHRA